MLSRLSVLLRCLGRLAMALGLIAILVGRNAAEPERARGIEARTPAAPRYLGLNPHRAATNVAPRFILDLATGTVARCRIAGAAIFDVMGCSPWLDESGQHHLIIFSRDLAGRTDNGIVQGFWLARCTYPRGEIRERFSFDPLPIGHIAWSPDRTDRFIFAAGDGRLYRYTPPGPDGSRPASEPPRPIAWGCTPPGTGMVRYARDPRWLGGSASGGQLLVSLGLLEDSSPDLVRRLWCLQLSPDGATILGARRLLAPGDHADRGPRHEERLPSVGATQEGKALLAYLLKPPGRSDWELWVAALTTDDADGARWLRAPAGRKLSEGCVAVAPAFSADGKWVYARVGDAYDSEPQVRRFPVGP